MQFSLAKLPWYAQIGAFVALTLAGVGAFYYYYERPVRAEMTTRRQQLVGLRADISRGQATARQLPEFQQQVADLREQLDRLSAVLPEEKDAGDLLRQMQTVAVQSNLVIKNFRPQPTVTRELHAEWPIQLELEGTYHNLAAFFDRIARFTQIVNISNVDVKALAKPDANSSISATCVATTFVLLTPEQQATAAASAAGRRGGRAAPARRGGK